MPFTETGIPDLLVYEPRVFADSRGYFFESYNAGTFEQEGLRFPLYRITRPDQPTGYYAASIFSRSLMHKPS